MGGGTDSSFNILFYFVRGIKMTLIKLQTITQYSYDTETQQSRVLKNYTTIIGNIKPSKPKTKPSVSDNEGEVTL